MITIQGRVTVQGTDSVPLGLTSVNIANKWVWKDEELKAYGENKRVFVNKKGYYSIQIQKGDTLIFIPNHVIYGRGSAQYTFTNISESQTLNVEIKYNKEAYLKQIKDNPVLEMNLNRHIKQVNPEKLISVSGTIYSKKSNKPLKNVDVGSAFNNSTHGTGTFHLTNNKGEFHLNVPQGNMCSIIALSPNAINFYPQNDTIINLYL
ncbi:hypothetical protein [Myroides sp. N17-2]|uniref:hypothetical protein n=1 Tax=Myroides sp. N17-2 TaxID=2030799 RepID=UPI0020B11C45|nr:hypothetical protein [Myroides sp. N17-2]